MVKRIIELFSKFNNYVEVQLRWRAASFLMELYIILFFGSIVSIFCLILILEFIWRSGRMVVP